jgi:hypothetical protein
MVYWELLFKLHENGGSFREDEVAGALLITKEEAGQAIDRLVTSGRIIERDGILTNPRVSASVIENRKFSKEQSVKGSKRASIGKRNLDGTLASSRTPAGLQPEKQSIQPPTSLPLPLPLPLPVPMPLPEPIPITEKELPSAVRPGKTTWLTPYGLVWKERWGQESEPPYSRMSGALRPPHDKHGPEKLLDAWKRFQAKAKDPLLASAQIFVQQLGLWIETPKPHVPQQIEGPDWLIEAHRSRQ